MHEILEWTLSVRFRWLRMGWLQDLEGLPAHTNFAPSHSYVLLSRKMISRCHAHMNCSIRPWKEVPCG